MKVLAFAELSCDDCGATMAAIAPPYTEANSAKALTVLLRSLEWQAKFAGWRMEGPSLWAGDLCSKCWAGERILTNSELSPTEKRRAG